MSTCCRVKVACPPKNWATATAMIGITTNPPICWAVRGSLTRLLTMIPSRTLNRQINGTRVSMATIQVSLKTKRVSRGSAMAPLTSP